MAPTLHHEHEDFQVDTVAGISNGRPFVRAAGNPMDLASLRHIESDNEGGFGLNFKGSMLNLGFLREVLSGDGEWLTYEVSDSPPVREMVTKIESEISRTEFYRKYACSRSPVPRKVLAEFGGVACVCLLSSRSAPERNVLRDMLFERSRGFAPPASYRPLSLRFILHCADLCASARVHFDEHQFRRIVFFGQCYQPDAKRAVKIEPEAEFDEILNRWRVFFLHHYFSVALEGLLVATLHLLAEAGMGGMSIDQIVGTLVRGGFYKCLNETAATGLLSGHSKVAELLAAMYNAKPVFNGHWCRFLLTTRGSEELLSDHVCEQLERSDSSAAAGCVALLAATLARVDALQHTPYGRWALSQVEDPLRDITPAVVALWFNRSAGSWRELTLDEFLRRLLSRFVIEQHELMVPEKKEGTCWLRWDDDVAFFENAFDGPSPGNSRFVTGVQALYDLGLLRHDEKGVPELIGVAREVLREISGQARGIGAQ